jgi:hypothetical protein
MLAQIEKEKLVACSYYYGNYNGNRNKTARWNGEEFILWKEVKSQHGESITAKYGEFEPYQLVTWGTNWIPLHIGVVRIK